MTNNPAPKLKIYIIGNTENFQNILSKLKINKLEEKLIKKGFNVINPLEIYSTNESISAAEAARHNINELLKCDAVCITEDVVLSRDNLELKMCLDLDLLIFHSSPIKIDFNDLLQIQKANDRELKLVELNNRLCINERKAALRNLKQSK